MPSGVALQNLPRQSATGSTLGRGLKGVSEGIRAIVRSSPRACDVAPACRLHTVRDAECSTSDFAPDRGAFQITKELTMSDKTVKGIDRRELIMASIATVGAAALAANAGSAKAQGASAPSAGQAPSGTVYTGEVIQGKSSRGRRSSASSTSTTWNPARSTFCIFRAWRCPPDSTGMCL